MSDVVTIDGGSGEGGGQVLRTAVGLSMVTGRPVRVVNVRANRDKPGLRPQHLSAVMAAARVCGGVADGASVGSREVAFYPGKVMPGEYQFDIGTAGSATLVLQTLLPALMTAEGPSRVTVTGGTHNPFAPPAPFLRGAFQPALRRMGASVGFELIRPGFYPAGGGAVAMQVSPRPLRRIRWVDRGALRSLLGEVLISHLPIEIARREMVAVREVLRPAGYPLPGVTVREAYDAAGPGNVVTVRATYEHADEVFTGFGQKGVPAEEVGHAAAGAALSWLMGGVPVGTHLADQILIPMALAGGGEFLTLPLDPHTPTNAKVIEQVLGVATQFEPAFGGNVRVIVGEGAAEGVKGEGQRNRGTEGQRE